MYKLLVNAYLSKLLFLYSSIEIKNLQTHQNMDISLEDETNYYDYENTTQSVIKDKTKRKRSNSEPRTGEKITI